jgi:hypothetical protein
MKAKRQASRRASLAFSIRTLLRLIGRALSRKGFGDVYSDIFAVRILTKAWLD